MQDVQTGSGFDVVNFEMKTRIAPTPSGFLHLGNLYSFFVTSSIAKKNNATVLLRIDDLDSARVRKEYLQDIFDTLHFFNIHWHEGPRNVDEFYKAYSQQLRLPLYEQALAKLVQLNAVFACSCTRSQLSNAGSQGWCVGHCEMKQFPLDKPGISWRIKTNKKRKLLMNVFGGEPLKCDLPDDMREFVVRKKDGFPSYQLASVVDDLHFGVDLIVRGQDLFNSTIAQLYLSQMLENKFEEKSFYHHPLITENGMKLSKSSGSNSIAWLRKQGCTAEHIKSLINFSVE